jgi:hypothetical protein
LNYLLDYGDDDDDAGGGGDDWRKVPILLDF